jgi:2-polyprenyl-3-methyl-5-hydroxy-6-metoxy-1,4-benzoquinol methylase
VVDLAASRASDAHPACPLCGSTTTTRWKASSLDRALAPDDLAITDHRYGTTLELFACTCGYRFAAPDAIGELVPLYGMLDDPGYEESADARRAQQRALLAHVMRSAPEARTLLDVGAANGLLVEEAGRAGLDATGVEPSVRLAASARSRGLDVVAGVLDDGALAGRRFDVVTLVDVVEHVADPVALLRAAVHHTSPGGHVLVVTPDIASVPARVLRDRWWHLRLAHVGYFTRVTLADALLRAGLVPERWWRPGWVFEVGYLTERVGEYVPPARKLAHAASLRRVLDLTIPLNLFDSWAVLARRDCA